MALHCIQPILPDSLVSGVCAVLIGEVGQGEMLAAPANAAAVSPAAVSTAAAGCYCCYRTAVAIAGNCGQLQARQLTCSWRRLGNLHAG